MRKLLCVDGFNIVRRIYEANKDPDSPEKAHGALQASLFAFKKLRHTHQPSHLIAAFDYGGNTWRHDIYDKYKANREPTPAALREALPDFFAQLAKLNIAVISIPNVEADDVIATAILRWLNQHKGTAIVVSTDKDLLSLITHGAQVWDHFKNEWHDEQWVIQKFGVPPTKLIDLFALSGDASDNIPGASSIGVKTAAKLINAYGDLDAIFSGAGILKNTIGTKLRQDAQLIKLSKQLVTLKTDVHLGVTWNALQTNLHSPL